MAGGGLPARVLLVLTKLTLVFIESHASHKTTCMPDATRKNTVTARRKIFVFFLFLCFFEANCCQVHFENLSSFDLIAEQLCLVS